MPLLSVVRRAVGSLTRLFADQADPPVVTHFSKYGNVYTGLTSIVTILGGFGWIADRLEKRLEKSIKDSDTHSKERTEKVEKSIKDSDTHSKERTEKVEKSVNERTEKVEKSVNERTDKLEKSVNERTDKLEKSVNERTDKLEQKLDGISRDIRENTQSVHARIDHVLLTALKLRSVPPPGE